MIDVIQKTIMEITEKNVEHIASLSKIKSDKNSNRAFTDQLKKILKYIEKLNELDTDQIEPTLNVLSLQNVFKEDLIQNIFSEENSFENAPCFDKGHYQVPKIIE